MNKNILIVLGGAVLAAVLVAVLVQVTLGGKKSSAPVGDGVEVLVAARDLKKGAELDEGDLIWKEWPEDALFKGAITRDEGETPEEALSGRLERGFAKGEAVVRKALLKDTKVNYVAARLNPGERAVSIKVNAEGMVAGFISPGSYVDVILTYNHRVTIEDDSPEVKAMVEMNLDDMATETILERIRVLAIDQTAEREEDDKIKVGKTVTLAVSIRDAEKLALASQMGDITLAMRGVGDDAENEKAPATTDARMTSIDDEIYEEYKKVRKDSGVAANTVKIFSGSGVQQVPVR
ncbi:MAG: Flp pilus assembly protein CpaB [Alcanivorax sp.]